MHFQYNAFKRKKKKKTYGISLHGKGIHMWITDADKNVKLSDQSNNHSFKIGYLLYIWLLIGHKIKVLLHTKLKLYNKSHNKWYLYHNLD